MPSTTMLGLVGTDGGVPQELTIVLTNMKRTDKYSAVYQISNPVTGEYYIGATSNIGTRIDTHIRDLRKDRHENYKLQKSILETDILGVTIFPVETPELAFAIESEHIKQNKGNPLFLNIKDVGPPPMLGRHHSDETKEKISKHNKQMYENGYINPFLGKTHTDEYKQESRERTKKLWEDEDFRQNQIEKRREIMSDPLMRENISNKVTELWQDPEYREHQLSKRKEQFSDPAFREHVTNCVRERMKDPANREISRQAAKKQWENSEFREMKTNEMKQRQSDPKVRKAHSEKMKEHYKNPENRSKASDITKKLFEDPEYKEKHRKAMQVKNGKQVTINGITYNTLISAATSLNLTRDRLDTYLRKNNIPIGDSKCQ